MTAPTIDEQLTMFAIVRGFVEYDDAALLALWNTVDPAHLAIGLASYAAVLVIELAQARGITPQEQLDQAVRAAVEREDTTP